MEKKSIKEISKLIDQIIDGSADKNDYKHMSFQLNDAITKEISYDDIVLICETVIKIAKTKNRSIRHLERYFWDFVNKIPHQIMWIHDLDISDNEELLPNTDYDNTDKKILSRLFGLTLEILEMKDNNSKASDLRRSGSLRLIGYLVNYYHIPIAKELFIKSTSSKNETEQFTALEGLEYYYEISDDEIEDDLIEKLDRIKDETEDDTVASTCLQIQVNAGVIDEMTAMFKMDDWKEDHYY